MYQVFLFSIIYNNLNKVLKPYQDNVSNNHFYRIRIMCFNLCRSGLY